MDLEVTKTFHFPVTTKFVLADVAITYLVLLDYMSSPVTDDAYEVCCRNSHETFEFGGSSCIHALRAWTLVCMVAASVS